MPWASFDLVFDGETRVPPHVWRSATGRILRDAVCITGFPSCTDCLARSSCPYPAWFEPDPPGTPPPRNTAASPPVPYALHAPRDPSGNSHARLRLMVAGRRALEGADVMLRAIEEAAWVGLGKERIRMQPIRMAASGPRVASEHLDSDIPFREIAPPDAPEEILMSLDSPLRLLRAKRLVGPDALTGELLTEAVKRRFELLAWATGSVVSSIPTGKPLNLDANGLSIGGGQRYSARQDRRISLSGLTGQVALSGPGLATLWPWLWAGQFIQIGKGTTQGLGAYRLFRPL
jgi:hypothetical protein